MDTMSLDAASSASVPRAPAPPAQSQESTTTGKQPVLSERRPQAATTLLDLPNDLLRHFIPFLRTENTVPAIRNAARFRAACERLRQTIAQPIPDGMAGVVAFNRMDLLAQTLLELQQSGKDVVQHMNCLIKPLYECSFNPVAFTPLQLAASAGHGEMATALIAAGANVNQVSQQGTTALLGAAGSGNVAIVQMLLQAGATVENRAESDGVNALMVAAMAGHTAVVQALLAANARLDITLEDDQPTLNGWTTLILVADKGHAGVVQALLQAGAQVDQPNGCGLTALMFAARNGHADVVQALLDDGAGVDQEMYDGSTALIA
ncbi:MAG: Ankyrin, partial [Naasia sp.]|nr:Ankyrin [Naasia sp.]